jgi:purine nucleoside permease
MLRTVSRVFAAVGLLALLGAADVPDAPAVIAPKVVVVAMFEIGNDSGDKPGEFQFWVEREHLTRLIPLPAAFHGVRTNSDESVIGIVTGRGNTSSASSIMALGLDPRFDLRKSYWVIAGIAGIDPKKGSIGSAVWTDAVVDGDLSHEIDAREMPPGWSTGFVPLDRTQPYEQPVPSSDEMVYRLNPALLQWAYALTRNTKLADNAQARARRMLYAGYPRAQAPPSVLVGADVSSSRFWAGALSDRWANDWTRYYTHGRSTYVTTAMEDAGTLHALTALARAASTSTACCCCARQATTTCNGRARRPSTASTARSTARTPPTCRHSRLLIASAAASCMRWSPAGPATRRRFRKRHFIDARSAS